MSLLEQCQQWAAKHPGRIVFPDCLDERALRAALYIKQHRLGEPILLANPFALRNVSLQHKLMLRGLTVIDPTQSVWLTEFIEYLATRMPDTSEDKLRQRLQDPLWFGTAMLALGKTDYCVAGNLSSTANVLRAGLRLLGLAPGNQTLSSIFVMVPPEGGQLLGFADCGVVPQPTAVQLADIAISSAESFEKITGETARVAMLSFSSKGSAKHANVAAVQQATEIVCQRCPDLIVDGELQFDAAMVPTVAAQKVPDSPLAGQANVLVFPSLEAGNIGYKIAQRLGGYTAIGPLIQGLTGPLHDLSRGCSWQDMVQVALLANKMHGDSVSGTKQAVAITA